MPTDWNAETYRARARQWRSEAETRPPGVERDACVVIADGYAHLAALIEKDCGPLDGSDQERAPEPKSPSR